MFWYHHVLSWWGYPGVGIGEAFLVLLIFGVFVLIMFVASDKRTPKPPLPSAEQILGARFARGEISETEYHDRLSVLHGPSRR